MRDHRLFVGQVCGIARNPLFHKRFKGAEAPFFVATAYTPQNTIERQWRCHTKRVPGLPMLVATVSALGGFRYPSTKSSGRVQPQNPPKQTPNANMPNARRTRMPDLTQNARKGRDMRPFQSVGIFSLPLRPYASAPGLKSRPSRRHCMYSAEAANSTSVEELMAVSQES